MRINGLVRFVGTAFVTVTMCLTAAGARADGAANFKADVNAAIDAGLAYSRANNYFTAFNYANGLSLLTLLEKESIPAGYNGLTAADKVLAQNAACILIADGNFGARAGFYSYYDGQVLMGLSVYLDTGGPDTPTGVLPYDCTGKSARATIDKVVDRSIAAQTPSPPDPAFGNCTGYWGYAGTGCDSSTTQFTLAGLLAAKGFYSSKGESADKNRIPLISATLALTADGYAANGTVQSPTAGTIFDNCGTGCYGHGYQANYGYYYGSAYNSPQQTASGTWGQLAGDHTLNDASVQNYLRWLRNEYNFENNAPWYYGAQSYFYYLWSSSKTFNIIKESGLAPTAGNIGPDDMGTLPAVTAAGISRLANRDPTTDVQPAPRGAGGAGYYGNAPKGWYYDYAYRLMSLQTAPGLFPNPNGSWGYPQADHAYAILVLQRSLGGACIDTDKDGVCDNSDNCPATANADQADGDNDGVGNVCDNCPANANPDQADSNHNGIGDACEVVVQKCDVDGDKDVDTADLTLIRAAFGQTPTANDPRDANNDGKITINDVRACTLQCTRTGCATN